MGTMVSLSRNVDARHLCSGLRRELAMTAGLIISVVGAVLALIGMFTTSWVDEDVVKFADVALYSGYVWGTGIVFLIATILNLAASVTGFVTLRKKFYAMFGLGFAVVGFIFLVLTPFQIRGVVQDMIGQGMLDSTTAISMAAGYTIAFLGTLAMVVGCVWTLGAQPILGPTDRLLRVALLWQGKLIKETTFTENRDITIGDGVRSDFVVPTKEFGKSYPLFRSVRLDHKAGYEVGLKREMRGRISIGGGVVPIPEYVKKQTGDAVGANYVPVGSGDWGVLEFGEVNLFFQFVRPDIIIGRQRALSMDHTIVAAVVASLFVVMAFFTVAQFLWNPFGGIEQRKVEKRMMSVDVNVLEEKVEQLLEIGEEEDTVGKKAEGEEGKFGDPDKDPSLESKVPKRDGMMVSKIDPKKIGLANVLSNSMKSGAISSILSDNADAFDNKMAVAMAGTGSELTIGYGAGGMGFKGTGSGGGGTGGYGRIHGLGRVDTGGGMGMRAGLGKKGAAKVGKMSLGGFTGAGFCQRNDIQSKVMQRAGAIRACYEQQLQIYENLAGKVTVRWTVNIEGDVDGASVLDSTLGNSAVEQCVMRAIRRIRFAKPEGGVCVVQWPFVFNPG